MEESTREEAALKVLCALISNESVLSRTRTSEEGKATIVTEAYAFVDALETGAYEIELTEEDEPEVETEAAEDDGDETETEAAE